jgi:hypothetical protein
MGRQQRRRLAQLTKQMQALPLHVHTVATGGYSGPDAAELHHAAVTAGAVEVPTGTPRLLARIEGHVGVLTFNSPRSAQLPAGWSIVHGHLASMYHHRRCVVWGGMYVAVATRWAMISRRFCGRWSE